MLVIDPDPLKPVDLLDLINKILLQCLGSFYCQNIVRIGRPIDQRITRTNVFTHMNGDMTPPGNQIFLHFSLFILRSNSDSLFLFDVGIEFDNPVDLTDDSLIFWNTGFKQFRNSGKTSGDVLILSQFPWDFGKNVTGMNHFSVFNNQFRFHGKGKFGGGVIITNNGLSVIITYDHHRSSVKVSGFLNHLPGNPGNFVNLLFEGFTFKNIPILNITGNVR